MTRQLFLIFLLTGIFSCRSTSSVYERKPVRFKVTDKFQISKAKTFRWNQATYIRIDYKESVLDEYISVTWLPKKVDLEKEIANFSESRLSVYKSDPNGKPVFGTPTSTTFASNAAECVDYNVSHEGKFGSYIAFHCENITVIIGQHFTSASEADSKKCLQTLEESWSCK